MQLKSLIFSNIYYNFPLESHDVPHGYLLAVLFFTCVS